MIRSLTLVVGLFALPCAARADEGIAPETVETIKKATVFIRVQGDGWASTGSGFVVAADDKNVLIATNDHVATPRPPAGVRPSSKPTTVTVVFDSGTKAERSYTATIAALDPERDLAVLRVTGVKDAPKPVAYADPPKLIETAQVYTFGFPFGKALSTTKGSPAITVGKASVSSLRNGDDGELSIVQIDGNLNPGNSGGPVVDAKGRLAGVAVATIRDGQGIGLTVPSQELVKMMRGRVGALRVTSFKKADGSVIVRVHTELIDPTNALRAPTAHYVLVAPKAAKPDATALAKHPSAKKIELKIENGIASAEFTVPAAEGEVLVQVTADAATKPGTSSPVRTVSLVPPPKVVDLSAPPPLGWKEVASRNRGFTMWIPTKVSSQGEEEKTATVGGEQVSISVVDGSTNSGLFFEGQVAILPPALAKRTSKELIELFRDVAVAEIRGRVTESKPAEMGTLLGEEYTIKMGAGLSRVRIFASGSRVYVVQIIGSVDQATQKEAEIILSAFRLPSAAVAKGPNDIPAPKKEPLVPKEVVLSKAKDPQIIAGGANPLFKDLAPAGGMLIGMEIGVGKFGKDDVIKSMRPIYRVGDKEQYGTQRGTMLTRVTVLKAKDGYAVGALTCKSGLNFDGCSLTFMKVVDGKLDPKDSYESAWVGYNGNKRPTKLGGDGAPVVGLAGRASDRDLNGLGLLLKGQEDFETNPPQPVGKEPVLLGGYTPNTLKDAAPEGGLLVGFEFGLVNSFGVDRIRAARPIYRTGGKETFGERWGAEPKNAVTVKAKEGYAVGRVTVKHGLAFEGCSVTFMKVVNGKLDPKDKYESEWIGFNENRTPTVIGDGTPVIGIVGRVSEKEMIAMGLLFKGQESFNVKK